MKTITLTFETPEQANNAVVTLSNGYPVEQWFMRSCVTSRPYCVRFIVSDDDVKNVKEIDVKEVSE